MKTNDPNRERRTTQYDLEPRTEAFAKAVRAFAKMLPRTIANREDIAQLVRASGSLATNYIEANESLSRKDFLMRIKISRKETKEARLFIRLVDANNDPLLEKERATLEKESTEILAIFGAILRNSQ